MNWNGIVSLFIACIEIILLVNLLIFSEKNRNNILIYIILFLLAGYQAIEFFICSLEFNSSFIAYLAFADISYLPPLNLILFLFIFNFQKKIIYLIFIPALFFILYYMLAVNEFAVVQCTVLYATYNYPLGDLYGFFYYIPIFISFVILLVRRNDVSKNHFYLLFTAHLFIMLPVIAGFILLYLNIPGLVNSMESILCKFAFGYAVALSIFCLNNKLSTK